MVRPTTQPILRSVNRLLDELGELTAVDQLRAESARNLARQLDAHGAAAGGSGAVAQALPAINRELHRTVELILAAHGDSDPFLASLFADQDGFDLRVKVRALQVASGHANEDDDDR